ncbi:hypothetical protein ACFSE0_12580 [Ochrobactrum teleogrylli]|uniref:Uncharacterized protein n=1 Tax=Ochrobactrum teleogrylli TaxID=2479765 RepID=A0ABY2Y3I2_9HYPH|nr:hypothetical protein [[Ochrobactrum] teleogrylli]TNV15858.1 hypothetical protein FIC94_11260 [[Ochrobactrum] teleogrylli]
MGRSSSGKLSNILFSLATVVAVSLTSPALATNDPYVGGYIKNCPGAQCLIEITTKNHKKYNLRFVAADPMNAKKILCEANIPMKRDAISFTALEQYDDALLGSYKSDTLVWLLPASEFDGSITFRIEDAPCGKFDMSGEYGAFGDE